MFVGPVTIQQPGTSPVRVSRSDTLADLAARHGVTPFAITTANGIRGVADGSCAWGRDIATWLLAIGGGRNPVSSTQPNACEPGKGFPHFPDGGVVWIPSASSTPPPPEKTKAAATGFGLLLLLLAGYAATR